jgi:hypothetical protein
VDQNASKAGWDVFLFGVPLLVVLFFGFFRLDEVFTSRKKGKPPASRPILADDKYADNKYKESWQSDPDGRPWDRP